MTIELGDDHVQSRHDHASTSRFSADEVHDRHVEGTSTVPCVQMTEIGELYAQQFEQPS